MFVTAKYTLLRIRIQTIDGLSAFALNSYSIFDQKSCSALPLERWTPMKCRLICVSIQKTCALCLTNGIDKPSNDRVTTESFRLFETLDTSIQISSIINQLSISLNEAILKFLILSTPINCSNN